jgi:CDP-glucose 4,6-dehydratase
VGRWLAGLGYVVIDQAFWRGRRVLVTGETGFKGSWLVLWLQLLGAEVSGLSTEPPTEPWLYELARIGEEVEHYAVDVRDAEGVERAVQASRPEVLLHLAAQPLVRRSFASPRETLAVNVMGTANVLDAARRAKDLRVVVNVTSDKCYENREWEWGYREDEPMGGFDPYSVSKGCSELVTAAYRRSFFAEGDAARLASARAGNVIGGGDWGEDRLIPDLMRGALSGEVVDVRRPDAVRPWQHVLNPLGGYLMLAQAAWDSPSFATAFNFGPPDEDARPVDWIVERLAQGWPEPLPVRVDPGPHPHEATHLKLDSSRARTLLDWRPRWDLERALNEIVAWYLALRAGEGMRDVTLSQIEEFSGG